MWPSKMRAEQRIADVLTLTGESLRLNPKMVWKSSGSQLPAYGSPDGVRAISFQQKLRTGVKKGMTLREFEKYLA
jgi:hypothetical protein